MLKYTTIPAILMPLNEALKKAGVPTKYIPLVNLIGGLIGGLVIEYATTNQITVSGAVSGILAGTSGGGIYDLIKR